MSRCWRPGFTRVGEFHYLHHDKDGAPYDDIAEMAERIAAAARETGIGLTLLPVFYAHSGFGGAAPIEGQRRFINSVDRFEALMDGCRTVAGRLDGAELGVAPHSPAGGDAGGTGSGRAAGAATARSTSMSPSR